MIYYFTRKDPSTLGAFNLGGTNGSGQVPDLHGRFTLIDPDTPQDAYTRVSPTESSNLELVFSDEFNTPNRTFYPGDDPFWEAVDLHYWATNNLEWYDPASITTADGSLVISLMQKQTHDLNYQGGMLSTWNKFCFTGGYVETKVQLPGVSNIEGLWPAIWMMGNLGRAGYGATLEGMWPYTYDACDVGTVKNQSIAGNPPAASVNGDAGKGGVLSYLPGQRLSRCTCDDEDHPGPKHSDGSFVGRAAPEIDIFEAQVTTNAPGEIVGGPLTGQVSQSAQWAVRYFLSFLWHSTRADSASSLSTRGTCGRTLRTTRSFQIPPFHCRTRSSEARHSKRRPSLRRRTRSATSTRIPISSHYRYRGHSFPNRSPVRPQQEQDATTYMA